MAAMIVGIDEVGHGPWAGPMVIGAVVLGDTAIEGLTDSKKLSALRRESLAAQIYEKAAATGLGWVEAAEIDEIGLSRALQLACRRALEQIRVPYQQIIIDGTVNFLEGTGKGPYVTTLKKADLVVPSVSAASIIAKVARDAFMKQQDERFPGYGFATHVGYGTAAHRAALERLGPTPLHRMSFAPLREKAIARKQPVPSSGATAEEKVAEHLQASGFTLHARNWRTKWCEIDIIAEKDQTLYFVEVKYRRSRRTGDGLAAITPRKLRQMRFAAEMWLHSHDTDHRAVREYRLAAVAVGDDTFTIEQFVSVE